MKVKHEVGAGSIIVDALGVGVLGVSRSGVVWYANSSAVEFLGLTGTSGLVETNLETVSPELARLVNRAVEEGGKSSGIVSVGETKLAAHARAIDAGPARVPALGLGSGAGADGGDGGGAGGDGGGGMGGEPASGAVAVLLQPLSDLDPISQELAAAKELNRELEEIFDSSYDEIFVT
ncbi:MAG: hypothetical protein H5T84_02510, partial [Thermoleophilia bacterium]|nr:hypothetical protein [Thermoleophilia bacterium]